MLRSLGQGATMFGRSLQLRRQLCAAHENIPGLRRTDFRRQLARQRVRSREIPRPTDGPIARVAHVAVRPEHRKALVANYNSSIQTAYQQQPGFFGAFLLIEGDDPGSIACSITLWEGQEHLDAAVKTPVYTEAMHQLASHFNDAPETKTWTLASAYVNPKGIDANHRKISIQVQTSVVEANPEP